MSRAEIVITQLDKQVIAGPVKPQATPGVWRAVPYTSGELQGALLGCGDSTAPEAVTIKLGAIGKYRIWIGLPVLPRRPNQVRVRLTSDLCCTLLETPVSGYDARLFEIHWKDVDLAGQDLILEGAYDPRPVPGALAMIRLEPIEELRIPPQREISHPMALTEDGHGIFSAVPHRRPQDILDDYEAIPDGTALKIMLWCTSGADTTTFPTKAGQVGPGRSQDYAGYGYGQIMRNIDLWQEKGWNSMELPRDYCRSRGWEFHISVRPQAFVMNYPWDEIFHSNFFHDHPEWNCLDAQGQRVARMSYAYPEVQQHMLALIDELVAFKPDGINLIFIRGVPLVLYEPIMVEGFQRKYGIDPRTLSEFDKRWTDYQAEVITPFVRAVKSRLKPSMRLSVIVPGNKFDTTRWGLDVETWVREGIVNDIYALGQRFNKLDYHADAPDALDLEYFHNMPGRERIRLFAASAPRPMFFQHYPEWRQLMESYLARGADGFCMWDGAGYIDKVGDIGLAQPADIFAHRLPPRPRVLNTLGGLRIDRYHPIEGF